MYPPVEPIIFQIGPLALRWYGILLVSGMILAAWIASRYVTRHGEDGEKIWDMLVWVLIPGLIGARLYYVFVQSPRGPEGLERFLENPITILQIWTGGIHIYGAFILGGLSLLLFARWNKLNLPVYLDGLGLGIPLGQGIGRWANFINQELYGPPTTLACSSSGSHAVLRENCAQVISFCVTLSGIHWAVFASNLSAPTPGSLPARLLM